MTALAPPATASRSARRRARLAIRLVVSLGLPQGVYYGLRAADVGIYRALLAGALVSAVTSVGALVRTRRLDGISTYMTAICWAASPCPSWPAARSSCWPATRS